MSDSILVSDFGCSGGPDYPGQIYRRTGAGWTIPYTAATGRFVSNLMTADKRSNLVVATINEQNPAGSPPYVGNIIVSRNGGKTWRDTGGTVIVHGGEQINNSLSIDERGALYAANPLPAIALGIYKSTDFGVTWVKIADQFDPIVPAGPGIWSSGGYVWWIEMTSPFEGGYVGRCKTDGTAPILINTGVNNIFRPCICGAFGGVDTLVVWTALTSGFPYGLRPITIENASSASPIVTWRDDVVLGGTVFVPTNNTFFSVTPISNTTILAHVHNPTTTNDLYVSFDTGASWTIKLSPTDPSSGSITWFTMASDPHNHKRAWTLGYMPNIYFTIDGGVSIQTEAVDSVVGDGCNDFISIAYAKSIAQGFATLIGAT